MIRSLLWQRYVSNFAFIELQKIAKHQQRFANFIEICDHVAFKLYNDDYTKSFIQSIATIDGEATPLFSILQSLQLVSLTSICHSLVTVLDEGVSFDGLLDSLVYNDLLTTEDKLLLSSTGLRKINPTSNVSLTQEQINYLLTKLQELHPPVIKLSLNHILTNFAEVLDKYFTFKENKLTCNYTSFNDREIAVLTERNHNLFLKLPQPDSSIACKYHFKVVYSDIFSTDKLLNLQFYSTASTQASAKLFLELNSANQNHQTIRQALVASLLPQDAYYNVKLTELLEQVAVNQTTNNEQLQPGNKIQNRNGSSSVNHLQNYFISAFHQSAAIGRNKSQWLTHTFNDIAMTMVLNTADITKVHSLGLLPYVIPIASVKFLNRQFYDKTFLYKWPNDIYINDSKVLGMISEVFSQSLILGLGLNVFEATHELIIDSANNLERSVAYCIEAQHPLQQCNFEQRINLLTLLQAQLLHFLLEDLPHLNDLASLSTAFSYYQQNDLLIDTVTEQHYLFRGFTSEGFIKLWVEATQEEIIITTSDLKLRKVTT